MSWHINTQRLRACARDAEGRHILGSWFTGASVHAVSVTMTQDLFARNCRMTPPIQRLTTNCPQITPDRVMRRDFARCKRSGPWACRLGCEDTLYSTFTGAGVGANLAFRSQTLSHRASLDGTYFPPAPDVVAISSSMKIVVQNRKTNAFLTPDAKWVRQFEAAHRFANSLEALRFCARRELHDTELLVCFPGHRDNLRVPLT